MEDRVCIVTGATSGIGRATAQALAAEGATLGIVCRDRQRGDDTLSAIQRETGNQRLRLFLADLGSQQGIRRVAQDLLAAYPQIHVLVNNAGVMNLHYSETEDGIETVFAVNHLGYFLLTQLLLDRLRASAPARIVNVASDAHKLVKGIQFEDLGFRERYRSMRVYGQSKLANLLFTAELARRLEGSGVTVNALHPGAVATGLGANNGTWTRLILPVLHLFFRSPAQGADTSIWLATAPEIAGASGAYFANRREVTPSAAARDQSAARRLWDLSESLTRSGGRERSDG
jgi:NAD(P)-dependent dehydrogenase (short-subunit alcohol dehydrogenase family)